MGDARGMARAIGAPGRPSLTYDELARLVTEVRRGLRAAGIARQDRVAIVLPNGPEMATAFVAISSASTAAPLNPAYSTSEFEFFLRDLDARALVTVAGFAERAREVAARLAIPVIELRIDEGAPAGRFAFPGDAPRVVPDDVALGPDEVALVLHTSGTTARPKLVPLTTQNLAASARHIGETLALTPDDVCLNVMPLFHIHGLVAAVLASLAAGASVVCTRGFDALSFFGWLGAERPTWYTAVPTMHQAILTRAAKNREVLDAVRLRFVRSSSSSLPAPVMRELAATFRCPVIESYGMTEAAHQTASNPLPPREQKPGSVGLAAGPEMAVMAEDGRLLAPGEEGEVVLRGPNVTRGYAGEDDAARIANEHAFRHGWFHTGDRGSFDRDGYLRLSGRLKELINRGGEKVSPLEVDAVLLEHPSVAQAVAFALPHPMLGEDVAAAVVLREGMEATDKELRAFVGERLASFKVPKKIVFVDAIPKGATGKVQRIGLARLLGLAP